MALGVGTSLDPPLPGAIHLWRFRLNQRPEVLEECRELLDDAECARADRLIRPQHQHYFAVGRGTLRVLLSAYVGRGPRELEFIYNAQGKPALSSPAARHPFSFNLSHSGDFALCAIAGFDTVGADVEACRESRDLIPIARRFFSPAELAQLLALPQEQHTAAFYQCWSSKEALLKAWGTGLSTPLDRFTVRVSPDTVGLLEIHIEEHRNCPWQIYRADVPAGLSAAVAVPGVCTSIETRDWITE